MIRTRTWTILIGIVLVISVIAAILMQKGESGGEVIAKVYVNNECIHTVKLSDVREPYILPVTGENGTNTISLENGRIRVSEADCPDQVCVNQGWQSSGITPIVCLPNKLVIELERYKSDINDAGLDGVIK